MIDAGRERGEVCRAIVGISSQGERPNDAAVTAGEDPCASVLTFPSLGRFLVAGQQCLP